MFSWGEGIDFWWGSLLGGWIFLGGRGGRSKFLAVGGGGTPPPSAPEGKTLMFDYLIKTSIINFKEHK